MSWNGEERRSSSEISQVNRRLDDVFKKLDDIDKSINGNGQIGLKTQIDRNTQFRVGLVKALWFLLTPLYAVMITMLISSLWKVLVK